MIDHVSIRVADYARSKAFFEAALAPLGYRLLVEIEGPTAAFGMPGRGKADFWISPGTPTGPIHLAFASTDRATVRAFHAAALSAGGTDNGPPGVRAQYHPDYYGAFVLDPDGNNVEAVCRVAPSESAPRRL